MKRAALAAAAILVFQLGTSPEAAPPDTRDVLARVLKSVVSVQGGGTDDGTTYRDITGCTAWSIDRQRQLFVTAAHCVSDYPGADHRSGTFVLVDVANDIAVLKVPGLDRPTLDAGPSPWLGQPVWAVGHGYGDEFPLVRWMHVSNVGAVFLRLGEQGFPVNRKVLALDNSVVGGMSGGPVVDEQGRVVSLVQMGDHETSWGPTLPDLMRVLEDYWRP